MKTFWVLIFSHLLFLKSFGQDQMDTIYYDKNWRGVSNPIFAEFYRVTVIPRDTNYKKLFKDYYLTGELQGSGGFLEIDRYDDKKSIFDGDCFNYFKNGKVGFKHTFINGKPNGEFVEYNEQGLIKVKGYLKDGQLQGIVTEFFDDGNFRQTEFENGKNINPYYILGNQRGQIIKIKISDNQPLWESPLISERKNEFRDGKTWQYYWKNGLLIAQTNTIINDYGKWFKIDLVITNNSMVPIEFDPEKCISAISTDRNGKLSTLDVWSSDRYMKKVRTTQGWAAAMVGLSEGLSTMGAGYSTSTTYTNKSINGFSNTTGNISAFGTDGYSSGSYNGISNFSGTTSSISTTSTYDATAAYQARVLSQQRMADFSNAMQNDLQTKQLGYLKKNTIYPGETIQGYINIERDPGIQVDIKINIQGAEYIYAWSIGK